MLQRYERERRTETDAERNQMQRTPIASRLHAGSHWRGVGEPGR
jgi:hypothetical protein